MTDALTPDDQVKVISAAHRISDAHLAAYGRELGAETTYNIIQELKAARTEASASLKEEVERLTTERDEAQQKYARAMQSAERHQADGQQHYERAEAAETQRDGLLKAVEPFANLTVNGDDAAIFAAKYPKFAEACCHAKQARDTCTRSEG